MKKVIALALSLLVLVSVGIGQTRTAKQQAKRNSTAVWEEFGKAADGDRLFMNVADMSKAANLAIFDIKAEVNGVLMYSTIMVNCMSEMYLGTNTFVQSSESAELFRLPDYDMKKVVPLNENTPIFTMSMHACRNGKDIVVDK